MIRNELWVDYGAAIAGEMLTLLLMRELEIKNEDSQEETQPQNPCLFENKNPPNPYLKNLRITSPSPRPHPLHPYPSAPLYLSLSSCSLLRSTMTPFLFSNPPVPKGSAKR